ncbi:MAG: 1-acyl-sn-glycerol-3-phosphate acyltransferase [Gemmatimonadetes bacterium]|nr:1-acyl-sn-glycerol-3-phosphate acyltransferase [Gemmatimonadota bacterium]
MRPEDVRSPRFLAAARWWARREIRRTLDGLRVAGLREAREVARRQPVIFAATHVAWWDPFLLVVLDEALGTEGYALMDAENLCRIPFFARLGAIPVQRGNPRAGLRAGAALLDRPGRAVWFFPQGRHRPAHLRPLDFQPGIRLLARLAPNAAVVPVALQYAFAEAQGPVSYACFGTTLPAREVAEHGGVVRLERAVEEALARIDANLAGAGEPFQALIPSREWGANADPGTRLLNALLRPRAARAARAETEEPAHG